MTWSARSVPPNNIKKMCILGKFNTFPITHQALSGSFYHHAKIVRKTSIPLVNLLDFLSVKNDVNVALKVISRKIV
jgi:hypothetical protein